MKILRTMKELSMCMFKNNLKYLNEGQTMDLRDGGQQWFSFWMAHQAIQLKWGWQKD